MAFSKVQANGAAGTGTAPSVTLAAGPTAGNLLVAGVDSNAATAITMTSAGWTPLTSVALGTGGSTRATRMFWKIAGASESATVTAAAASALWTISVIEYSPGGATVNAPTQNAQSNASGSTQPTPTVTPTAGKVAVVVCFSFARLTTSAVWSNEQVNASTTGVNTQDTETPVAGPASVLYDQFVASTSGTYAGTATFNNSAVGAGAIAVFTGTASGSTASTADTSASSTVCTRVLAGPRGTADASASADSASATKGTARSNSDTSASSDVLTRSAQPFARATADTTLSTEAASRVVRQARSGAGDTSLSTESLTARKGTARATADTSASTTALTRSAQAFLRSAADTSLSTDALTAVKTTYDAAVLADSPVLYLNGTGTTDAGSGAHTITKVNSPGVTTLPNGENAFSFSSAGTQYVEVADANDLSIPTSGVLTIECWMKPAALTQPHEEDTGYVNFLNKADFVSSNQYEWQLRMFGADTTDTGNAPLSVCGYVFSIAGGTGDGFDYTGGLDITRWEHFAVVYKQNPSGFVKIYHNGVLVNTQTPLTVTPANGQAPFRIGAAEDLQSFFYGAIGKVAVYSTALTATRLLAHYNAMAQSAHTSASADTSLSTTSCTRVLADPRSITDTSLSTDAATRVERDPRAVADTTASSDVLTRSAQPFARAATDASLSTESTTRVLAQARATAGDTSLSVETFTARKGTARATADTSLSTDTLTRSAQAFARATADSSASSTTSTRALASARASADTSLSTDSMTAVKGVGRFPTDTSLSTDAVSRTLASARTVADFSVSTEQTTRVLRFARSTADTSVSTETTSAVKGVGRFPTDTTLTSDSTTRVLLIPGRSTTDSSLSSDQATRIVRFGRSSSDSSLTSEAMAATKGTGRASTDTSLSSNTTSRGALQFLRSTADTSLTSDVATAVKVSLSPRWDPSSSPRWPETPGQRWALTSGGRWGTAVQTRWPPDTDNRWD